MLKRSSRWDVLLLATLFVAVLVIFARPMRVMLDAARTFEDAHGLSLIPALLILSVVFIFQQQAKRQEVAQRAAAAAASAEQARERAAELEALVAFGRQLSETLDIDAVKEAAWCHIPRLMRTRDVWVLVREASGWSSIMGSTSHVAGEAGIPRDLITTATSVIAQAERDPAQRAVNAGRHTCFPMMAAGAPVGVMGVSDDFDQLSDGHLRVLAATAALLGIAVRNAQLFREIRESSVHDSLTGCLTRAYTQELLDAEYRRAIRSGLPLSAVMFDLDHFKQVNDRLGHLAGDAVLAAVGRELREVLRGSDLKCRYGGEEFLLLLPDTPHAGATRVAESLRQAFVDLVVRWDGQQIPVSASFGVATIRAGEREPRTLVARADSALYRAKEDGRNCVRGNEADETGEPSPARLALVATPAAAPPS